MKPEELLQEWRDRAHFVRAAYYERSTNLDRFHYWIGVPAVILSTIVGTSAFATMQQNPSIWVKGLVGVASVLVAVLTGIQTFLRYNERAEMHRMAAVKYGMIKREIEEKMAFPKTADDLEQFVKAVRLRWDKLREDYPTVPQPVWDRVSKRLQTRDDLISR